MNTNFQQLRLLFPLLLPVLAGVDVARAQNVAIFPDEYAAVPEGPLNSPNLPLARGTSRVMCLYRRTDLQIPSGDQITKLGFREDGGITTVESGVAMQLEIRMGWTDEDENSMSSTFDNNYQGTPVTVFGPTLWTPPTLRDPSNPLPNGQFFIPLSTPFAYVPNGRNLLVEYRIFGTANGGQQFNYRLDRADFYSPVTTGPAGCPHSGGPTPILDVDPTRPGFNFGARVSSGPANAPAFLAINIGSSLVTPYSLQALFPGIAPSCMAQMAPVGTSLVGGSTNGSGGKNWSFFIPNNPALEDIVISAQSIMLDFFSPGTVVVSNGSEVLTGARPRTAILSASGVPSQVTTGSKNSYYCPVAFFEHQ